MSEQKNATGGEPVAGRGETQTGVFLSQPHSIMNGAGLNNEFSDLDDLLSESLTPARELIAAEAAGELAKLWQLRTLKDAYTKREPIQYLVDKLIPLPSLCVLYGAPGSLKTMILGDMAVCVASGQRWLEALPVDEVEQGHTLATKQAPVLWIDFDNGTRRTDERFDALARSRNLPVDAPIHYVSMPRPWLDASSLEFVSMLAQLILSKGVQLVVIDNLGLVTGDVEENSAEMSRVMGNLRWLCEETDSAIIVIHHQRKAGANAKDIRKGETLRGHSSIEAALDLALLVERKEGSDSVAVIPTKMRGYRSFDIFGAQFTYDHKPGSYDLAKARFFSEAIETPMERERKRIVHAIESELTDCAERKEEPSQRTLVQAIQDGIAADGMGKPPGRDKIRGILSQMVKDGEVLTREGERRSQHYRLAARNK